MMRTTLVALAVLLAGCTQLGGAAEEGWLAVGSATQTAEGTILQYVVFPGTQDLDAARAGRMPHLEIDSAETLRLFVRWPDATETEAALRTTTFEDERRVLVLETDETGFVDVRLDWRLRLASGAVVTSERTQWDAQVLRRYQAHADLHSNDGEHTLSMQFYEVAPGTRGAFEYAGDPQNDTLLRLTDLSDIVEWHFVVQDANGRWHPVEAEPALDAENGRVVVRFDTAADVRDARIAFGMLRADGGRVTPDLADVELNLRTR